MCRNFHIPVDTFGYRNVVPNGLSLCLVVHYLKDPLTHQWLFSNCCTIGRVKLTYRMLHNG